MTVVKTAHKVETKHKMLGCSQHKRYTATKNRNESKLHYTHSHCHKQLLSSQLGIKD